MEPRQLVSIHLVYLVLVLDAAPIGAPVHTTTVFWGASDRPIDEKAYTIGDIVEALKRIGILAP